MSVPIERRIRQIQINLERRRWQNRDLGDDSFYVNLADSGVKVVLGGESGRAIEVTNAEQLRACRPSSERSPASGLFRAPRRRSC